MFSKRQKNLSLLLASLFLIMALAGFGCKKPVSQNSNLVTESNINTVKDSILPTDLNTNQPLNNNLAANLNTSLNTNQPAVSSVSLAELMQADLKRLASSFSSRLGTYSNQSNYTNLIDLKPFMTEKMKTWAEEVINKSRASQANISLYYGVTTKALSTKVIDFDPWKGKAEILVSTQRREASGTTSNIKVFYQDILVKLIKNKEGVWKVDAAEWQ